MWVRGGVEEEKRWGKGKGREGKGREGKGREGEGRGEERASDSEG